MSQKIPSDPAQLKDRLNQPRTTLVEALKQVQATMPLSPLGEKELHESEERSANGRRSTASSRASCRKSMPAAASIS